MSEKNVKIGLLVAMRLSLGWIMFWAFIDKMWGLGFATVPEDAWLVGGSPTTGFLMYGTKGPFAPWFQALAGQVWVDGLFMAGLALIGLALIFGIGMRIAGMSGAAMMVLLWLAALPPEHNPFMDEHLIYAFMFISLSLKGTHAGHWGGLGRWWSKTALVKRWPWLE